MRTFVRGALRGEAQCQRAMPDRASNERRGGRVVWMIGRIGGDMRAVTAMGHARMGGAFAMVLSVVMVKLNNGITISFEMVVNGFPR